MIGRAIAGAAVMLAVCGPATVQPAVAQNLLDVLFGGFDQRRLPPRVSAYADPSGLRHDQQRRYVSPGAAADHRGGGPASGFCVRSCDGFHFPVRSSGAMTATEMCRSSCPGAQTQVFSGSRSVDHSVGPKGQRYGSLDTAFLYRARKVDGCTCNGRHAFGLVPLKPDNDPTLRPGDIVATNDGLVTFNGSRKDKTAEFTPIAKAGGSSEWRLRLMSIKVAPAPEPDTPVAAAPVEEKQPERRRAQRPAIYR